MEIKKILQNKAPQAAMKHLMSDEIMDLIRKNMKPKDTIMAYYRCAIMEVETKFKVLNEQFSLEYDRNPIESIKSRTKSMESLAKKIRDKNIPISVEAIEENINDIAEGAGRGIVILCKSKCRAGQKNAKDPESNMKEKPCKECKNQLWWQGALPGFSFLCLVRQRNKRIESGTRRNYSNCDDICASIISFIFAAAGLRSEKFMVIMILLSLSLYSVLLPAFY